MQAEDTGDRDLRGRQGQRIGVGLAAVADAVDQAFVLELGDQGAHGCGGKAAGPGEVAA